jgi:2-dehydropantoate 2-reductase
VVIRIVGAGALGMVLAARLTLSGAQVELVSRTSKQTIELREKGLLLTSSAAEAAELECTVRPEAAAYEDIDAQALPDSQDGQEHAPEYVLLTVKQSSITDALALALSKQLKASARLVCFQNGIGHMAILQRHIPAEQIWAAVTTEGALKRSPRHVEHTGSGTTWLGSIQPDNDPDYTCTKQKKLQNALNNAGFSTSLSNNITRNIWNKLLMNTVINPLTAILQVRNGELLRLPSVLPLMRTLYEEGAMLADKLGIELAPDLWEQLLDVCERTAANQSSMLQDVRARRQTETDAITGGLLAEAWRAGVELPTHAALYYMIRSIEQQWEHIK